jgi:hypothetical protein
MSLRERPPTRNSPERKKRGGDRGVGGRPEKENVDPSLTVKRRVAVEKRHDAERERKEIVEQHMELSNRQGRSWSYDECVLLLTLILGFMRYHHESATVALQTIAEYIGSGYMTLHTLWVRWRESQEVYVVDTSNRGGGSPKHINHSPHISMDVMNSIRSYIQTTNESGGGVTTIGIIRQLIDEHSLTLKPRYLRSILYTMGLCIC